MIASMALVCMLRLPSCSPEWEPFSDDTPHKIYMCETTAPGDWAPVHKDWFKAACVVISSRRALCRAWAERDEELVEADYARPEVKHDDLAQF